jgi:pimeloyl-ACP methyl ester carboxylesterase
MIREIDIHLADGRVLHAYDTATADDTRLPVFWHHGSPNVGSPPEPLFAAAEYQGLRWVSYDRPAYGGSTAMPGRDIASAADDVAAIADELGIERFAVLGHSGGGAHALACAAKLSLSSGGFGGNGGGSPPCGKSVPPGGRSRVLAAVSVSGLAPPEADGLDWYAGMYPGGAAELRAASAGRAELEAFLAAGDDDPEMFTPEDHAALAGDWAWLGRVAGQAIKQGMAGFIDDDLAATRPWGYDPRAITVPVLLVHGEADRMVPVSHASWLASRIEGAEAWLCPGHGHISVLAEAPAALGWLAERVS